MDDVMSLHEALNNLLADLQEDQNYCQINADIYESRGYLQAWHKNRIEKLAEWVATSEKAVNALATVDKNAEYKQMLREVQTISQGFDDSFDWSNAARRIEAGVNLVYTLAKRVLMSLNKTQIPTHMLDMDKKFYEKWQFYKNNPGKV